MKRLITIASLLLVSCAALAQQDAAMPQEQTPPQAQAEHRGPRGERGEIRMRGTAGAISEINGDTITLKSFNGENVKVKVSDKTEYRKEQQPAKLTDFKPGDFIMVRGEPSGGGEYKAEAIMSRPANGRFMMGGEGMGTRFIAGEVKAIDGTKLTVHRIDDQDQTIEVDENTSFRKQGESITLPDIKVGDKVFGRGEMKNATFVPQVLNVGDLPQMRIMRQGTPNEPLPKPDSPRDPKQNNEPK
jgi:uncharacterized protein YdeI (BOF family)